MALSRPSLTRMRSYLERLISSPGQPSHIRSFCDSHEPRHCAMGSAEPQPRGALDPTTAAVDEPEGRTNRCQARLGVASAGDVPLLKTYNSVWQTLWQSGCRLLITRQDESETRLGCWFVVEPRRNRTGDPILTMEPPGTAVRTAISPGHARPSRPKLSVLFRRSYALSLFSSRLDGGDVALQL